MFPQKASSLFNQSESVKSFYHIHSYHLECKNPEDVAASIRYAGTQITVSVEKDNVFGVQFHPEKSQDDGLDLLFDFTNILKF